MPNKSMSEITAERAEELATELEQQEGLSAAEERVAGELSAALRKLADLLGSSGPSKTTAQLAGEPVEYLDAPANDGVYVLRRHKGDTGAAILFYAHVYSSYMPTLGGARKWAGADHSRQMAAKR